MKKVVGIIGASGLIGAELARAYKDLGMRVVRISRSEREVAGQEWRVLDESCLRGLGILINLAGEPIDQKWTKKNKAKFHTSRVELTQRLGRWMKDLPASECPSVWLNTSAVGIYGDRDDEMLDESSTAGEGYLAELCAAWEQAAHEESIEGCRILHPRIGVVLGHESQAWLKIKKTFLFGVGGKLGSGKQWFPWVHLQDVVGALVFLSQSSSAEGAYNIVAPEPVTNAEFTKTIAAILHRPAVCTAPAFILRAILGEFSQALLASQRVIPKKLEDLDYNWNFTSLESAISELSDR